MWLVALTAYLFAEAQSGVHLGSGTLRSWARLVLSSLFGVLFFWWGQRFLLGGRVPWRALLPGAIATTVGLGGLRLCSSLVFSPLIAVAYGAVGTVLIVTSWLIGVGFVVFGGPSSAAIGSSTNRITFRIPTAAPESTDALPRSAARGPACGARRGSAR